MKRQLEAVPTSLLEMLRCTNLRLTELAEPVQLSCVGCNTLNLAPQAVCLLSVPTSESTRTHWHSSESKSVLSVVHDDEAPHPGATLGPAPCAKHAGFAPTES